jgi:hypothetical protein
MIIIIKENSIYVAFLDVLKDLTILQENIFMKKVILMGTTMHLRLQKKIKR